MPSNDLPEAVRTLLRRHVASVLELDVLLAMRSREGPAAPGQLARELRLNETACAAALEKFTADGLFSRDDGAYSFGPRDDAVRRAVDALAEAYAQRRVSVIRFIFQRPSEGVSAFADAFKLRRRED